MVSDRVQFTFRQTASLRRWATNSTMPPGTFATILLTPDTNVTLATIEYARVTVLLTSGPARTDMSYSHLDELDRA